MKLSLKNMLFLHGTLFLYAIVSIFAKLAGTAMASQEQTKTLLFIGLEFFVLVLYTLLWQLVLKRMPLSFAYTNKAICTVWTILFGVIVFGEMLTLSSILGIVVVLAGVVLVVTDHE